MMKKRDILILMHSISLCYLEYLTIWILMSKEHHYIYINISPVNTSAAGPVINTWFVSLSYSITRSPPLKCTSTLSSVFLFHIVFPISLPAELFMPFSLLTEYKLHIPDSSIILLIHLKITVGEQFVLLEATLKE